MYKYNFDGDISFQWNINVTAADLDNCKNCHDKALLGVQRWDDF